MIRRKNVDAEQAAYKALQKNGLRVKPAVTGKAEDYAFVVMGDQFSVVPKPSRASKELLPNLYKNHDNIKKATMSAVPDKQYVLTGQFKGRHVFAAEKETFIKP